MERNRVYISIIIIVVFFLGVFQLDGTRQRPSSSTPGWDCCWQIWATGANLGWATSLMWYTQSRTRWAGTPDDSLYRLMITAGQHVVRANQVCSRLNPAWPNWRQKRNHLDGLARSFRSYPTSSNRRRLHSSLKSTYNNFGNPLKRIIVASRYRNAATCSEKYFKMAWLISYAQQTLKIAAEDERYRRPWRRTVRNAQDHVRSAINVLYAYFRLRPVTGSCVNLSSLNLVNRLREIANMRSTVYNLGYMITEIDSIWGQIDRQLKRACSTSSRPRPQPGLTNVTVNRTAITLSVWDHGREDGDRVDIYLNNRLIRRNLYLTKRKINIYLTLNRGTNTIKVYAINEGRDSPNTASINISDVVKGKRNQKWRLKRGQTGTMQIYFRSGSGYYRR